MKKSLLWLFLIAMAILLVVMFSLSGCRSELSPVEDLKVEEGTGEPEKEALDKSGVEETIKIEAESPPILNVSQIVFSFLKESSEEELKAQLVLSNNGGQELLWDISNKPDWLVFSKTSGSITTKPDTLTITAQISNLNFGIYEDEFQIVSNGGNKKIQVNLRFAPKYKIKVMTYNILLGAGVDPIHQQSVDKEYLWGNRLDEVIEVIQALDPDILAIQEANSWELDNEATAKQVAQLLNMNYCIGDSQNDFNVALYTKFTISDKLTYTKDFSRAVQWVQILTPEGDMLNVFNVHLHPTDENLQELDSLARTVEPYKNEPTIVMGDFNCNPSLFVNEDYRLATNEKITNQFGYGIPGKLIGDMICVPAKLNIFTEHLDAADAVSLDLMYNASDHVPMIIEMGFK